MNNKNTFSPGYMELILHQFVKNKLAVTGVIIIMLLFFIACFGPLLANSKPLALYGQFPDKYEDTYYITISNIEQISRKIEKIKGEIVTKKDKKELESIKTNLKLSIKKLTPHLQEPELEYLKNFKIKLFNEIKGGSHESIEKLSLEFEERLFLDEIDLQYVFYSPAIRSLTPLNIFFMALYPLTLVFLILKNFFRKKKSHIKLKREMIFCLIASLLASLLWFILVKPKFDPTDYKLLFFELTGKSYCVFPVIPYGENENIITEASQKPTWLIDPTERTGNFHVLGTDTNGRDVLCRMIWGTRISMSIGFIAVGLCFVIGVFFGSVAGYFRGWVDISISRVIEIVICFPVFFLILTVLAFLRPSIFNIMVVIGVTGWTGIARLCRGEFLKLAKQQFVTAAEALGASSTRIIFKHILPNGIGPILVSVSFGIAGAILTESALSFLGFGVPQPTASWGDLLNNGRNDIQGTWWLTLFPGLAIFITVTAFNLAGEGIRDALDPRLKKQ